MLKKNLRGALVALLLCSLPFIVGCPSTVRPHVDTTQSATWTYEWQKDGVVIPFDAWRSYDWLLEEYGKRIVPPYKPGHGLMLEFADGRRKITYDAFKLWLQLLDMHDRAQVHGK